MAKTLIATFILWIAVVAFALAQGSSVNSAPVNSPAPASTSSAPAQTSTAEPPAPASTSSAPAQTSTADPPAPASTSSKPPTSAKPSTSASTNGSSVSPHTGSSPTKDPNATSTAPVVSASQAPATTLPPSVCHSNPCLDGSTCEERYNQTFVCLCKAGDKYSYDGEACVRAKVFPGQLNLVNETYFPDMANKTSSTFKQTAAKIEKEIDNKFKPEKGYSYSLVVELRNAKQSKVREGEGNVEASVQILYDIRADITLQTVKEKMGEAFCKGCPLEGEFGVKEEGVCPTDPPPCDNVTTLCNNTNGSFKCICKSGYYPTNLSDRICLACSDGKKHNGIECVPCSFGLAGLNCNDNSLLIAVIVSSVVGGLLIIGLIALSLLVSKSKKKGSKIKEEDIGKPYQSHSFAKPPPSYSNGYSASIKEPTNSSTNYEAPRIPRAISNWESRTNLEMTPSNSGQNLISSGRNSRFNENQDDMFSFSQGRPKNNFYEQIPPNSNPYAQNRATNPYTQNRGQTNPYYS